VRVSISLLSLHREGKSKPGQGLEMDAYRRLFWVLGFWWCPPIDKFEKHEAVMKTLNALEIGGNAM